MSTALDTYPTSDGRHTIHVGGMGVVSVSDQSREDFVVLTVADPKGDSLRLLLQMKPEDANALADKIKQQVLEVK